MGLSDEGKIWLWLSTVADAPYVMTCHFESYEKQFILIDTLFWYSEEFKVLVVTVGYLWWSPCRG